MKEVISFNSFRYSCHVYIDVVFCCKSYGVSYNIFTWNYYHHNSIEKAAASRFYFNDYDQSNPMNILSMVMDFFFYKVYTVGTSFPSSSPVRGGCHNGPNDPLLFVNGVWKTTENSQSVSKQMLHNKDTYLPIIDPNSAASH